MKFTEISVILNENNNRTHEHLTLFEYPDVLPDSDIINGCDVVRVTVLQYAVWGERFKMLWNFVIDFVNLYQFLKNTFVFVYA